MDNDNNEYTGPKRRSSDVQIEQLRKEVSDLNKEVGEVKGTQSGLISAVNDMKTANTDQHSEVRHTIERIYTKMEEDRKSSLKLMGMKSRGTRMWYLIGAMLYALLMLKIPDHEFHEFMKILKTFIGASHV